MRPKYFRRGRIVRSNFVARVEIVRGRATRPRAAICAPARLGINVASYVSSPHEIAQEDQPQPFRALPRQAPREEQEAPPAHGRSLKPSVAILHRGAL